MKPRTWVLSLCVLLVAQVAGAQETWILRTDLWGTPAFSTLQFARDGARIHGDLDGERIAGHVSVDGVTFTAPDRHGQQAHYVVTIEGTRMRGEVDAADTQDTGARARHAVSAWQVPPRPPGAPRTVQFQPTDYANTWDAGRAPVLVLWPGDTVRTDTVDSGGVDAHGITRALFGNPQTGPFFVAGAAPGDTLVVHLRRLRLNRDDAQSLDSIVGRALPPALSAQADGLGKPVRWVLDRAHGLARPAEAQGALAHYAVPVRPMLGGLGVAPGFGLPPLSTGDSGRFGGNMDFNEVVEGNTVYLPVQQPGALLYLGDAHALQGDGETSQYALETSMEVTFSVELIKARAIAMPRVESPTQLMALGQSGSLDEALKLASGGMIAWLQQDYGFTLSEAAQVLGTAVRYSVANLAGRSVGVAAKIDKSLLPASRHVVSVPVD